MQDQDTSARTIAELSASPANPLERAQVFFRNHIWYDAVAEIEHGLQQNPGRTGLNQQLQVLYRQIAPACANPAP